jgi:hypothetical protein
MNYAFNYLSKHKSGLNTSNRDKIKINSGITGALPQVGHKNQFISCYKNQ